jgi:SAM-dependent methyltransferase
MQRFLDANRRVCAWLERRLPHARDDFFESYPRIVASYMNARPGQLIADVGGGKRCSFARYRDPESGTRIVAIDVSDDEIKQNQDVDERRVANIMETLPFASNEVDLMVSSSVLEHLTDLDAFVTTAHDALKPGGYFIHLFPGRFAPFAMLNRAMPNRVARRLLHTFHPATDGICGFPAFYDRCSPSEITRLLERRGFHVHECRVSYYQSRYYSFFVPAYLASVAYELVIAALRRRELAAYLLVVAQKT